MSYYVLEWCIESIGYEQYPSPSKLVPYAPRGDQFEYHTLDLHGYGPDYRYSYIFIATSTLHQRDRLHDHDS